MTREEAIKELSKYVKFYKEENCSLDELGYRFEDILISMSDSLEEQIQGLQSLLDLKQQEISVLESKALKLIKILDEMLDIYHNEVYDLCVKYDYYEPKQN